VCVVTKYVSVCGVSVRDGGCCVCVCVCVCVCCIECSVYVE